MHALVQQSSGGSSGTTSVSANLTGVAAGSLLVAILGVYKSAAITPTFTGGGTWTRHVNGSGNTKIIGASCENSSGGSVTIQASWTGSADQDALLHVSEWSGAETSGAFDKSATATGSVSGNIADSGNTATTATANQLIIGGSFIDDSSLTVAQLEGMTLLQTTTGGGTLQKMHSAYKLVSATAAYKYRGDWSGGFTPWGALVMTFKESTGGGGGGVTLRDRAMVRGLGRGIGRGVCRHHAERPGFEMSRGLYVPSRKLIVPMGTLGTRRRAA